MNGTTTTANVAPSTLTLKDIETAMERVQANQPDTWVLVAPDGRCWTGKNPMQVAVKAVHGVEINARLFDPFGGLNPWMMT